MTGCVHGVSSGGTIDKFELLNALDRLGKTKEEVHAALRRLSCRSAPSPLGATLHCARTVDAIGCMSIVVVHVAPCECYPASCSRCLLFIWPASWDARTLFESMQVEEIVATLGGNFKPLTKDDFKALMLRPAVVVEGRQH